jgi:hypothetical protein
MKTLLIVNNNAKKSDKFIDLTQIQERVDTLKYDVAVLTREWDGVGNHPFLGYVYNSRFQNCTLRQALDFEACRRGKDPTQIKIDLFPDVYFPTSRYLSDRAYEATVSSLFSL